MAKNASVSEVIAARAFLRFLGKDWHNNGLVLAVIAWARVSSGRLSGNLGANPFKLYRLKNGNYVSYAFRGDGKAVAFGSLRDSFIAAAKALRYMDKTYKGRGFRDILISLNSGDAGEFLTAVATSDWRKDHYGLKPDYASGKWTGKNKIIAFYNTYTGLITPEAQAAADAQKRADDAARRKWEAEERARKAALAKYRRRPKQLRPPAPSREYLNPYAPAQSYRERHPPYELPE